MGRAGGKDRGLFQRPANSGIWWVRYFDEEGKEHREKVGPKELARSIYQQRKTEVRQQKFDPDKVVRRKRWTVAKMLAHYREQRKTLGPRNQSEDQRYVDYWTEQLGTLELEQVSAAHLERWRVKRAKDNVKPATINRGLTYLKAYFNLAVRDGHCSQNPVSKVKPLQENNERTRYLDPDNEFARLKAAFNQEQWDLIEFALFTGLRRSEQFGMRWEFVDFTANVVKIPTAKAGKARFIYLNEETRAILERQRSRYPDSPWTFPAPTKPQSPRDGHNFYHREFRKACREVGIQDFHWHDLRHSFASWLTMRGAHPKAVQTLLGVGSSRMMERYSHLAPGHLGATMKLLSAPTESATDAHSTR